MRIRAEAEVRLAPPVFQIVARFEARPREIRNLVARDARPRQAVDRDFIKVRNLIIGGNVGRAVALAERHDFRTQPAVFIHFEHVDGNVRSIQTFHPFKRLVPASERLAWQARD